MSEHVVHVYRVVEVAEHFVEDDSIYEDSVEMLRDVVDAAKSGLLEFEPAESEFVVMTWDEDSKMTVRAVEVDGGGEKEEGPTFCAICLSKQFETPSGLTCQRDHGGADSLSSREMRLEAKRRRAAEERKVREARRTEARGPTRYSVRRRNSR